MITEREKEVLKLVADGLSNQQIGECLFLSTYTVKGYIKKLNSKLGVRGRVELTRYYIEHCQSKAHKNILIIAPHPDDEVLGCFSFLGENSYVVYVTTRHPLFPDGKNVTESQKLASKLGFGSEFIPGYSQDVNRLETIAIDKLVDTFEKGINQLKPDTVLLPNPSYNQDHRVIYDAALTAMRHHDTNYFVKHILLYEQPETWDTLRKPDPFKANYFKPVDINNKIEAVKIYSSQLRGHRSLDYIKAIAKVRGQQANLEYAEAFEVVRWCE